MSTESNPTLQSPAVSNETLEQAKRLETLFPKAFRCLLSSVAGDPTAELPDTQLKICLLLQKGDRSISTISDDLGITVSAVTQLADRLERAKMLERVPDKYDRRIKWLRLTEHGKAQMQARTEVRVQRIAQILLLLSPEIINSLFEGVQGLVDTAYKVLPEVQNAVIDIVNILS